MCNGAPANSQAAMRKLPSQEEKGTPLSTMRSLSIIYPVAIDLILVRLCNAYVRSMPQTR